MPIKDLEYYKDLWLQKTGQRTYELKTETGLYSRLRNVFFDPAKNSRHEIAQSLLKGLSGKLLDVGCWGGEAVRAMGGLEQFDEVYGVDLIEESVSRARMLGIKASVCNLNENKLPLGDGIFDAVTCLAVIGQIFDPYFVLDEIHRVLKRNGSVILNVPNVASLPNRLRLFFGHSPVTSRDPGWDGGQLHYFTKGSVKAALEKKGFHVVNVQAGGGGLWLRQINPSLLSGTLTFKAIKR